MPRLNACILTLVLVIQGPLVLCQVPYPCGSALHGLFGLTSAAPPSCLGSEIAVLHSRINITEYRKCDYLYTIDGAYNDLGNGSVAMSFSYPTSPAINYT